MNMADDVRRLVNACLYEDGEIPNGKPPENAIIVRGVGPTFGLHPERVAKAKAEVAGLLLRLPADFQKTKGGGMSFLTACMDAGGRQWAEQPTVDQLLVLGLATDLVSFPLPRDMWSVLPGGMPYFMIDDDACRTAAH